MKIDDLIKRRLISVQKAINFANSKLQKAVPGMLKTRSHNGITKYYKRETKVSNTTKVSKETYIPKADINTIKALQEKNYYIELLKTAKQEEKSLKEIQEILAKLPSYDSVFLSVPEIKRNLIGPYIEPIDPQIQKSIELEYKGWKHYSTQRRGVNPEYKLVTQNGERVRSKSELIIADRLRAAGVPYFYERPFVFVDSDTQDYSRLYPDFQVLNLRTGEAFFWEHFGIMDDSEYCASCQYKLEKYAENGIFPGRKLIITMESSKHTLNTKYIDALIKEFLVD